MGRWCKWDVIVNLNPLQWQLSFDRFEHNGLAAGRLYLVGPIGVVVFDEPTWLED